ncbi:hypothetical protein LguiA_027194 [Lonicera macranthoides]
MSNTGAMYVIQCNYCTKSLSVAPFAQTIRCHGCNAINSIRDNKISTIITTPPNGTNRNHIYSDAKGVHIPVFWKRRSNSNSPKAVSPRSSKGMSLPSISEWKVKPGKRALLCGVSYNKQKFRLKGTINDVESMEKLLIGDHFKFPSSTVYILAEDERYHHPTKKNIQAALKWLVKDCQSGDSLVFYFSGHGLRQPDFYQDEHDGFDETICPVDFKTEGMILDNEINDTIVRPLKKGVTLHAIIDACHSGTILDLPLIYNIKEDKWDDNRPPSGVYKGTSGGLAISFSACRDDQLATDTTAFTEEMAGAMTYTLKRAIEKNPKITYLGLLTSVHDEVKRANEARCFNKLREFFHRKIVQEPMLSSSHEFNVNMELKL